MINTKNKKPLVSVVIINYNGLNYLANCIEAIYKSQYPNYELVVVDNGSSDGSVAFLEKYEKEHNNFKAILLNKNFGPAYARNKGVEVGKGEYIAFLDNDTLPDKNWLIPLIGTMEENAGIGACQCKLLLLDQPNRFDYAGDYLSQYGFLIQKADYKEIDKGQYDYIDNVLSAKSAAMIIRRDVFNAIGGFDEDYFIYVEETDLCWRVWLHGYKVVFIPSSIVYHAFGSTNKIDLKKNVYYRSYYHGCKNYIMTLMKNLSSKKLIKILPLHIILWIGMSLVLFLRGRVRSAIYIMKGIIYNILNLDNLVKKRMDIHKNRKASIPDLEKFLIRKAPLQYFLYKFNRARI